MLTPLAKKVWRWVARRSALLAHKKQQRKQWAARDSGQFSTIMLLAARFRGFYPQLNSLNNVVIYPASPFVALLFHYFSPPHPSSAHVFVSVFRFALFHRPQWESQTVREIKDTGQKAETKKLSKNCTHNNFLPIINKFIYFHFSRAPVQPELSSLPCNLARDLNDIAASFCCLPSGHKWKRDIPKIFLYSGGMKNTTHSKEGKMMAKPSQKEEKRGENVYLLFRIHV